MASTSKPDKSASKAKATSTEEEQAKPVSEQANGKSADAAPDLGELDEEAKRMAARFLKKKEELEVDKIFRALVKLEGSDLHLKVGRPPMIRLKGELQALKRGPIDTVEMVRLLMPMMDDRNRGIFEKEGGADFSYTCEVDGITWRFRINLLQQMGSMGMVARRVNNDIPDFEGLYLPPSVESLCKYDQGMVLLAGLLAPEKVQPSLRC